MNITDKTKVVGRRGRRAVPAATEIDQTKEPTGTGAAIGTVVVDGNAGVAPTSEFNATINCEGPATEGSGTDYVADAGSGAAPIGAEVVAGGSASDTGTPRESERPVQLATQQRPDTTASTPAPSDKVPAGKNARIVDLVNRSEGAGINELTAATGWQRHTVRAALSRLRQAGFAIELQTSEDGSRVYRHVACAEVPS